MKLVNNQGTVWYGIHFYPGVAQYQDAPDQEPYRVFLNENTLRAMDPTFAGRPIFVEHVDEVDPNLDQLRKEADGWVVESFYNTSDGKHWVKFMTVSERAERAIKSGMKLSNAYVLKNSINGGLWNGVPYEKEITDAEYEHLAIVKNPRYEESVIMTPEEFKKYNERNVVELKKIANSKGETKMKFTWFKKSKVENAMDADLSVILPKSLKEMTIAQLITNADDKEMDKNSGLADMTHKVKMYDGSYCNVGELLEKHKAMCDELESMKKMKDEKESEHDVKESEESVDSESVPEKKNDDEDDMEQNADDTEEDKEAKKKALQLAEHEEKEIVEAKNKKKNEARIKAERLKNAHLKPLQNQEEEVLELSYDMVARGKARYGS